MTLQRVWAEILGTEVGPESDFFALGGHSVAAARLAARVRADLGVDVPVSTVFSARTLAAYRLRVRDAPPVKAIPERTVGVSGIQRLQWFAEQLATGHTAYTIPLTVRIRGRLDSRALRRAVRDLVARHQVLRTRYEDRDGEPWPVVEPADRFAVAMTRVSAADMESWLRAYARQRFALATDLPVRATIVRLAAEDHVLAVVIHHIAADGWSRAVLLDELAASYDFHRGEGPALPPAVQYADVGGHDPGDVSWWCEKLRDAPTRTTFRESRPRPAVLSDEGASVELPIGGELSDRVRAAAAATGTTTYAYCMAALMRLLSQDSGETDVVVATSTAGRTSWRAERVVGCFINTVAIRVDVTAGDLVRQVQNATLDALDHPSVHLDDIVRELAPPRDPAYRPICQVMLTMHNEPGLHPRLAGLAVEWVEVDNGGAKSDVFVDLTDDGGPLRGVLTYRTQLYDQARASDLAARYVAVLKGETVAG